MGPVQLGAGSASWGVLGSFPGAGVARTSKLDMMLHHGSSKARGAARGNQHVVSIGCLMLQLLSSSGSQELASNVGKEKAREHRSLRSFDLCDSTAR